MAFSKAQELLCGVGHPRPLARQGGEEDLRAAVMLQVRFQALWQGVRTSKPQRNTS